MSIWIQLERYIIYTAVIPLGENTIQILYDYQKLVDQELRSHNAI